MERTEPVLFLSWSTDVIVRILNVFRREWKKAALKEIYTHRNLAALQVATDILFVETGQRLEEDFNTQSL